MRRVLGTFREGSSTVTGMTDTDYQAGAQTANPQLGARPRAGRSVRGDLRAALPDALAAVLLTAGVFVLLAIRVASGVDAALVSMPSMARTGGVWAYTLSQAFGFAALAWAWATILLGLSLPSGLWRHRPWTRIITERLHRSTSLTVLALILAHAVLLIWDRMGDTPLSVFVPFTTSYAPGRFPTSLGIIGFYLAVLVGPSFYLRDRLGPRTWRLTHRYVIPLVYVLGVWHTFLYGSDVQAGTPLFLTLWAMQVPIVALFLTRVLAAARRGEQPRHARFILTGIAAVVIVGIGISGARAASSTGRGMAMGPMSGSGWLPSWLGVTASAVFAGTVLIHLWHLIGVPARVRVWHGTHVLMALGMIDMFAPTHEMIAGVRIGQIVFGVAALIVLGFVVTGLLRAGRVGGLWPIVGVDLVAMVYMFGMPAPGSGWVSGLLIGWFVLQAAGWASGVLPTIAGDFGLDGSASTAAREPAAVPGMGTPGRGGVAVLLAAGLRSRPGAVIGAHAHAPSVRATLMVMSLGMAYMFLAMQFGMTPISGHLPAMGGM